jgi:probable rRNA maturation factor
MPDAFLRIVQALLPSWEISLAFVSPRTAQALNVKLRKKSYVPNVLSYKVGEKHGEVIICKAVAQKQAREFGLSPSDFLMLLFIHALLHLKGRRHGSTMERREWTLLKKFGGAARPYVSPHRNRNRRRHLPSEDSRG